MKLFLFVVLFLITVKLVESYASFEKCVVGQPTVTKWTTLCGIEVNAKVNMTTTFIMETSASVTLSYTDTITTNQVISFSLEIFANSTQSRCYDNGVYVATGEMKYYSGFQLLNRPFLFSLSQEGQQTEWTPKWKFDKEEYVNKETCLMDFSKSGKYLMFYWPADTRYHIHSAVNCVKA